MPEPRGISCYGSDLGCARQGPICNFLPGTALLAAVDTDAAGHTSHDRVTACLMGHAAVVDVLTNAGSGLRIGELRHPPLIPSVVLMPAAFRADGPAGMWVLSPLALVLE